jgi:hypothetical protein
LAAYTPIEPFDVLSKRLGRAPEDIVKLDANENPYVLLNVNNVGGRETLISSFMFR